MAEYIDRNVVVNALIDVENRYNLDRDRTVIPAEMLYMDLCRTEISLGKLPAADVAPVVHGRWNRPFLSGTKRKNPFCYCTNCAYPVQPKRMSNYCPGCGAKMDLEV